MSIFLATVVPLVIWYYLERETTTLELTVENDLSIISINQQFARDLVIRFRDSIVSSLYVIDVSLENTGTRAITSSDFEQPITVIFPGRLVTEPVLIRTQPEDLRPKFSFERPGAVRVGPLLLNPRDQFSLRAVLADRTPSPSSVRVEARIRGITRIPVLVRSSQSQAAVGAARKTRTIEVGGAILATVAMLLSITSLIRQGRELRILLSSVNRLDKARSPASVAVARGLGEQLGIAGHDFKSNLLLLRLKIESLLQQIARASGRFADDENPVGVSRLARVLAMREVIDPDLAGVLRDLAAVMNRELHEVEAYLEPTQFATVQERALEAIGRLEAIQTTLQQSTQSR